MPKYLKVFTKAYEIICLINLIYQRGGMIMVNRKGLFVLMLVVVITILAVGCGANSTAQVMRVESGAVNDNYVGVVNPELAKDLKLSEGEKKEGIEKITIKCGTQIDAPSTQLPKESTNSNGSQNESGGEDVVKPKI
jgi:hypothetical protein